jgi:hypothetical protein
MTDQMIAILENNNLQDFILIFEKNKILDIETASELTDTDLEKIGISALGDRKKILRIFSQKLETKIYEQPSRGTSQHVVVQHATMRGQDTSTGFGKGFGETVGKKAGGCAWSLGIIVIIIIIIAIIIGNL